MKLVRAWQAGLTLFVLWVAVTIAAPAQTFNFTSLNGTVGGYTFGPLVQGVDGNLYGAGFFGGVLDKSTKVTQGTIFKSTPTLTLSLVHEFQIAQGVNPTGLVLETNGNLYGTAAQGGANPCDPTGCGTVFGFTTAGTIFDLYSFAAGSPAGIYPEGGLTLGPDGSTFYGTTGGGYVNFGAIFKITPTGTLTTLHTFDGTDGSGPYGPLVLGTDGNLYGITSGGGPSDFGTIFEITASGTFTSLHSFSGADGYSPQAGLVQGPDGNFYGTTTFGGSHGYGTIFFITPGGSIFKVFHNFSEGPGGVPTSLVLGSDGNFYGVTSGNPYYGTVFEITPAGVLTTLHTFDGTDGGLFPTLMQHTNGTFYGTMAEFGAGTNCATATGCGTVFSLSTGLGSFVTAVPAYRGIGAKVLLLGQGFTGATSVTFNGVSATFTVNSDTEITTTVPAGATKGFIVVTTPSGIVSTKVFFTVA